MKTKSLLSGFITTCAVCILCAATFAADLTPIKLPAPKTDGGKPLMQALKERKSSREFSLRELPLQVLSDMLWAAAGINRPDSGRRTSPTARNMQQIDIYVVKPEGVYIYDANKNTLQPVLAGNIMAVTGKQDFVVDAPVNLVFVADYAKMGGMDAASKDLYAATDTGYVSQNVYLYCAMESLL